MSDHDLNRILSYYVRDSIDNEDHGFDYREGRNANYAKNEEWYSIKIHDTIDDQWK